jgi:GH15 family glucan-1,4-alpha-glucosidase
VSAKIESYAMIGNCRTAALVGLDGGIDWLCWPDFSSGACFAALLGNADNGRWLICPAGEGWTAKRAYRGDTMILETTFTTPEGSSAVVVDFMPALLNPNDERNEVVRIIRGLRGRVKMRMEVMFRFDYGSVLPWVQQWDGGIRATAGPDSVVLRSRVGMQGKHDRHIAEFEVKEGEDVTFALSYFPSHRKEPAETDVKKAERETENFWCGWSKKYVAKHPWRDAVMRSLLTLKALTFEPTGGIVAAATTSLPEELGGERNWDYRFCWIRDATLTLYALIYSGYQDEARAWRQWLLRTTAGDPADMQIMYGIYGERRLTELELNWLSGYEQSKPVRIGNGAHDQFQLDVFGELMGATHLGRMAHGKAAGSVDGWNLQRELMAFLEKHWNEPDNGIWEVRGPRRHFVHSKVMAWMAVDRSIQDAQKFGFQGPIDQWLKLRDQIHAEVCEKGFNREKNTFTQYYGGSGVDAALLIIARTGFISAKDPRYIGTVQAVERELLVDKTFVRRYLTNEKIDGVSGQDCAFLPCAFWLAEAYAQIGRRDEAIALFERLLALRNDVGLLSEEYDYGHRRQIGNFPQAFTHVILIATEALLSGDGK